MLQYLRVISMMNANKNTFSAMTVKKKSSDVLASEAVAYTDMRICIMLRGSAVWQINERLHPVQAGDIILLNSRQKRRFASMGADGFVLGAFTLDRHAFANANHFSFFLTCIKEVNGVLRDEALAQILTEIHTEAMQGTPVNYELISAKLTEFFIKAERKHGFDENAAVKIDKNMMKVLDYIDAHITEKISLAETATLAGFTESAFSRRFAKLNGVSFKKYVMSKKIEHAIYLLETTDQKVIDVAFECGFDSISGFYDTFRKITGTTPSKFTYII